MNATTATITAQSEDSVGNANATTTASMTIGKWYHMAAVFTSDTDRAAYIDAGNKGTNNTSKASNTMARVAIASRLRSNIYGNNWDGKIADAAVWTAALNDDQLNSLYRGVKPTSISPESLLFYAPFVRDLVDVSGGSSFITAGAPTVFPHPRRYG